MWSVKFKTLFKRVLISKESKENNKRFNKFPFNTSLQFSTTFATQRFTGSRLSISPEANEAQYKEQEQRFSSLDFPLEKSVTHTISAFSGGSDYDQLLAFDFSYNY